VLTAKVGITLLGFILATLAGSATIALGAVPTPTYRVQNLGVLPGDYASVALGINRSGDVVGWSTGPSGTRAFVYTDSAGMTALPGPAGRPVTIARAINDDGTVVGTASTSGSDPGHAVRWQIGGVRDLGTLRGGQFSDASGVNAAGTIVGWSDAAGANFFRIHAFRYTDATGLTDLTPTADTARAVGINDLGQIAGYRESRAFRLTGTTFTDLGVAPGFGASFGTAINGSGQVAGHVITGSGNSEQIFRYTDGSGMVILGGSGEFNRASGINAAGDVVGTGRPGLGLRQGFLYTDANGMQGLNALIDPAAGWFVLDAGGINDAGQIAGRASGPTGQRAVRLTPIGATTVLPPAAPSNLRATALSSTRVQLTWTDNSNNEAGFRIQRATGTAAFVPLANVGAQTTTYTVTTLKSGQVYRYRVQAFNSAGSSAWSTTAVGTLVRA
jgi:probable HAF family extracellular repeat protein